MKPATGEGADKPINTGNEAPNPSNQSKVAVNIPSKPVIRIRPTKSWVSLDLRDLWAYRELLYFLTWRDVKVRYKQTVLGAAWAIVQPLFITLIFTVVFGRLVGLPSDGLPYLLFAYSGLLVWTFFANAVSNSANSLVADSRLISKIYFPRMIIPGAAVGAMLVDLAVASLVLVGLMLFYGVELAWGILMLPVLVALTTLLALGMGMWLAALNVKYQDIRYALPFLIQLSIYVSPVIYPSSLLPERMQWIYTLNPLTGIIENLRAALFGLNFDWPALLVSVAITAGVLVYAAYTFRRMEQNFADIV